jgi:predicted transcriptional regulator
MPKTQLVTVRVTPEILKSLDEVASQQGISRSGLIRDLLENCHSLYRFLQSERERQRTDRIILDGNLSQWVLEHMPPGMTSDQLRFIRDVIDHAADMMIAQGKGKINE